MSTTNNGEQTFPIASVVIGEPDYERDAEIKNMLHAFRPCTVITKNGQFWDVKGMAFNVTEQVIRRLWDTDASKFTKRAMNPVK